MKNSTLARFLLSLVLFAAALIAAAYLYEGVAPRLIARLGVDFRTFILHPFFKLGDLEVTPIFLMRLTLFILILTLIARGARNFVRKHIVSRTSMDLGQQEATSRITGYVVFLIGLMVGLQSAGINLNSLVVLGGAIGVGVGFGLQTIANNFISGLILLVERPIKLGDRVEVGGTNGDVVRIAARSTWVRTNDNVVIIIPNSEFIANRITNWTANDRQVRFSMPVGVSYGSNPDEVREVLLAVALAHPDVLHNPGPEVRFVGFGDSSLDFELRVWTTRQVQTPKTLTSDLYFAVFRTFREHHIEIPFPQRDVHLKTVKAAIPIAQAT